MLLCWWLGPTRRVGTTPNIDIASTCTIDGRRGLVLVEAKAHTTELTKEAAGKRLESDCSDDSKAAHDMVGSAIDAARQGLSRATSMSWGVSRDSYYQLSNRFAWSWKLTTLGFPIVLVYLAFLDADEMVDQGAPFASPAEWEDLVLRDSSAAVPEPVWNQRWSIDGVQLVPLIRSARQPLCAR